jgi:hypothetical protein
VKKTRAQLLWLFQAYLDKLQIHDPERREAMSALYLEKKLSRLTAADFHRWIKTGQFRITARNDFMRTRGSRLAVFTTWLDRHRPEATREERERLTRLYYTGNISRPIQKQFHKFIQTEIHDGRRLPWAMDTKGAR